jgi:putative FmdB family regulatory protein
MPTYSYKCNNCGHQFDARQRMTDDPLSECPVCGGDVRRVVSSVGIVFKGKGFYVTDHRSSNGSGRVQTPDKSSDTKDNTEKPKKADKGSDTTKAGASTAVASSAA